MNLESITDLQVLKSMAYDQIHAKETAENNLAKINVRISQVENISIDTATNETQPAEEEPKNPE